jgi:hypothetical protein
MVKEGKSGIRHHFGFWFLMCSIRIKQTLSMSKGSFEKKNRYENFLKMPGLGKIPFIFLHNYL